MSVVFAAITPHPPILIPEIGKDHIKEIAKTQEAMKQLEQDLYAAKPDSIVIISPHGHIQDNAFTINLNADYKANFKDFGDFSLELQYRSDFMTIQEIRAADESNQAAPIVMSSEALIDYGFSVPLYCLTQHLKQLPIVPITPAGLGYAEHYAFGQFLYRQLAKINKRFAIIASADLSHKLTKEAPGGFAEEGKEFDKKIASLLKKKSYQEIVNFDHAMAAAAGECGLRSIITLLGAVETLNASPDVLSYEGPFGVGYMVCDFKIA